MSTPAWLLLAFDAALPELVGAERDRLAQIICDHLPGPDIAAVIAGSAAAVLKTRGHVDPSLAREIGANAAQCILGALSDDEVVRAVRRGGRK